MLFSHIHLICIAFRLRKSTFKMLCQRLQPMDIFQSIGRQPQHPVEFQLGCFLCRYGERGSDSLKVAQRLGLGHGTVFLYCIRVSCALREIGLLVVAWPQEGRKNIVKDTFEAYSGFPALGACDGSLICLTEDPYGSNGVFRCHKKFPAVSKQIN
jgi:hypothetical protein